mmetsp:Transcript_4018/g.7054  ORF Transcript_4018/g.7054 Transcript_4018/m.7054 type:complete len:351 (-) Transcript_4018:404-1456(-)
MLAKGIEPCVRGVFYHRIRLGPTVSFRVIVAQLISCDVYDLVFRKQAFRVFNNIFCASKSLTKLKIVSTNMNTAILEVTKLCNDSLGVLYNFFAKVNVVANDSLNAASFLRIPKIQKGVKVPQKVLLKMNNSRIVQLLVVAIISCSVVFKVREPAVFDFVLLTGAVGTGAVRKAVHHLIRYNLLTPPVALHMVNTWHRLQAFKVTFKGRVRVTTAWLFLLILPEVSQLEKFIIRYNGEPPPHIFKIKVRRERALSAQVHGLRGWDHECAVCCDSKRCSDLQAHSNIIEASFPRAECDKSVCRRYRVSWPIWLRFQPVARISSKHELTNEAVTLVGHIMVEFCRIEILLGM